MLDKVLGLVVNIIKAPVVLATGFIIGLLLGMLIGWAPLSWLAPSFQWTDAAPVDLSAKFGYQQQYLSMVAERYAQNPGMNDDEVKALLGERWDTLDAFKAVEQMAKDKDPGYTLYQGQMAALASRLKALSPPETEKPQGGLASWQICLFGLLFLFILVGGGWFLLQRMAGGEKYVGEPGVVSPVERARASQAVIPTDWTDELDKPVSQFVTTYELGDDRYDMSFAIESGPDFLGECGVAISETVGVPDPKKVTALEVWLFDKNDVRTITKVLMSEHCFGDDMLRGKLAPKGEAVLIGPDQSVMLDTQTLRLRVRVIEMDYGMGELPPQSFFDRVKLELAAWPKPVA
ncbi:MAG: hypothetical protein JW850_10705 [Thermoflexales bacterium]|nr:hypothetical protein [Thermoflexales bacterium]